MSFKIGDIVEVIVREEETAERKEFIKPFKGHEFTITDLDNNFYHLSSPTFQDGLNVVCSIKDTSMLKLLACGHDWKVYHGFRFDEYYCAKCQATKPFNPMENAS